MEQDIGSTKGLTIEHPTVFLRVYVIETDIYIEKYKRGKEADYSSAIKSVQRTCNLWVRGCDKLSSHLPDFGRRNRLTERSSAVKIGLEERYIGDEEAQTVNQYRH